MKKQLRNIVETSFAISFIVDLFAAPGMIILGTYSFLKYPECLFVAAPHLSEVAPILYNVSLTFTIVAAICTMICLGIKETWEYLYEKNKRR